MAKAKPKQLIKTKDGLSVCVEAQKMSDVFICRWGIDIAEKIAELVLEKIRSKRKVLKGEL
jgi:hypothetical protein